MPANEEFVEHKTIIDIDGIVQAIITFRTRVSGERLWSFSFMRAFEKNGVGHRTPWLNARHAAAVVRLTPIVLEEIEHADAEYKKRRFE